MNTHNDWKTLLKLANADLDQYGYSLLIVSPEEGFYNCEIWDDESYNPVEIYAENYYEHELSDLITEAWHYVKKTYL